MESAYITFATLNRNIVVIQKIIAKQTHTIQLKIQTNTANHVNIVASYMSNKKGDPILVNTDTLELRKLGKFIFIYI